LRVRRIERIDYSDADFMAHIALKMLVAKIIVSPRFFDGLVAAALKLAFGWRVRFVVYPDFDF